MHKMLAVLVTLTLLLGALPVSAQGNTLHVDGAGVCGGNTPCYPHPQEAVNAANPGDTILVYPGTYDSRCFGPEGCDHNDTSAPALIVYRDDLTIRSVEGPANTTIQATHVYWSNAIAVQRSTAYLLPNVQNGWAPNAVVIIANDVTIDGFTLRRPRLCENPYDCFQNTAGVFIGGQAAGYPHYIGQANNATVKNNVFQDVWHAVYIWHSSYNKIASNSVQPLTDPDQHWAAISIFDGVNDAEISYGPTSQYNQITNNVIADKGIFVGAWAPSLWADNTGTKVLSNAATEVFSAYSSGSKLIAGNRVDGCYEQETSGVNCAGKSNHGAPSGWTAYDIVLHQ